MNSENHTLRKGLSDLCKVNSEFEDCIGQLVKIEALNKSLREELDSPLVKNSRQQFIKLSEQKQDFNKQIKTFQIARLELDKEINKIKDKENQIVKIETYYKQKQEIYQNDISTLNRAQTELKVKEDNRINWELAFQQKIHMYESQISERNFEVKSLKSDISLKDSEIQFIKIQHSILEIFS